MYNMDFYRSQADLTLTLCSKIYQLAANAKANKRRCQEVAQRVKVLEGLVHTAKQREQGGISDSVLMNALQELCSTLESAKTLMEKLSKSLRMSSSNENKFSNVDERLDDNFQILFGALAIDQGNPLDQVYDTSAGKTQPHTNPTSSMPQPSALPPSTPPYPKATSSQSSPMPSFTPSSTPPYPKATRSQPSSIPPSTPPYPKATRSQPSTIPPLTPPYPKATMHQPSTMSQYNHTAPMPQPSTMSQYNPTAPMPQPSTMSQYNPTALMPQPNTMTSMPAPIGWLMPSNSMPPLSSVPFSTPTVPNSDMGMMAPIGFVTENTSAVPNYGQTRPYLN